MELSQTRVPSAAQAAPHRQNLKDRPPGKFDVLANALRDPRRGEAKTRNRRAWAMLKIPGMRATPGASVVYLKLGSPSREITYSLP